MGDSLLMLLRGEQSQQVFGGRDCRGRRITYSSCLCRTRVVRAARTTPGNDVSGTGDLRGGGWAREKELWGPRKRKPHQVSDGGWPSWVRWAQGLPCPAHLALGAGGTRCGQSHAAVVPGRQAGTEETAYGTLGCSALCPLLLTVTSIIEEAGRALLGMLNSGTWWYSWSFFLLKILSVLSSGVRKGNQRQSWHLFQCLPPPRMWEQL